MVVFWKGILGFEGQTTGDKRLILDNALTWDVGGVPSPLMWAPEDQGGHDGAMIIGQVEQLWRTSSGAIWGEGRFDDSEEAARYVAKLRDNPAFGRVSFDIDDIEAQFRETGEGPDDYVIEVSHARVRGATAVNISAFKDAVIGIDEDREDFPDAGLVASAAPVEPPAAWFRDPGLTEPTRLTITDEGRVFGHIAEWGVCHIGLANCVEPPTSPSDYSFFRTGSVKTKEGSVLPTGRLVMGGGHANLRASAASATEHYDRSSAALADVEVGEDAFGIWFSGALRPGVTAEQVREFRGSDLSGDWRPIRGHLELVAALSVSVGGFPSRQVNQSFSARSLARFRQEGGYVQALVSAGTVRKKTETPKNDVVSMHNKVEAQALALKVLQGV